MTKNGFYDLANHHHWATETLLNYCRSLDEATLLAIVPGTYGSILDTLRHQIDSDASYIRRLTGEWPDHPWKDDAEVSLDVLLERNRVLGAVLSDFLRGDWDVDKIGLGYGDDGAVFEIPAGVFVTQIFHHANEHRAHVCSALGALGIEPPDVSAWGYSIDTQRARVVDDPDD
jgi:uncharacterized damage-inducible protein DinB